MMTMMTMADGNYDDYGYEYVGDHGMSQEVMRGA